MKKLISALLSLTMVMSTMVVPVMAKDNITVELDGREIIFDVQPRIINERTMVPLRAIFEALGASVEWDQENQMVTSVKGDKKVMMVINNPAMLVNGKSVVLDAPACVVDDRTLVPVRAISEAFDLYVEWDNDERRVLISTKPFSNSSFYTLKNLIITKGTYESKYSEYIIPYYYNNMLITLGYKQLENIIYFSVLVDSEKITGFTVLNINSNENVDGGTIVETSSFKYKMMFEYKNGRRVVTYNEFPINLSDNADRLVDITLSAFDEMVPMYSNVTLADFGIYY